MKEIFLPLLPLGLLVSCSQFASPPPGAPQAQNQYGVPGAAYGEPVQDGGYIPQPASPYQPVQPISPPIESDYPAPPSSPSTSGQSYTIQQGDTLWGLSRRYGVSVDAIRRANNLQGDNIIIGNTLQIPGQ